VSLTKDERILRHKRFLKANWDLLSAFAWGQFQEQGRGAVVVDEIDIIHASTPQYAAIKLRYVADATPMLVDIGGWPGDRESTWVKTYEPDERVIVLIVREGGGTSGYLIGGSTKPSVAFARKRVERN